MHLNRLCLAGATLGALSLFLTWVEDITSNIHYCYYEDVSMVDLLGIACEVDVALRVAGILFIAGVGLAFVTTIGGFVELAGVLVFFGWYATAPGSLFSGALLPGCIGPYAGVASALLVILALVRPVAIGHHGTSVGVRQRLLTVVVSRVDGGPQRP